MKKCIHRWAEPLMAGTDFEGWDCNACYRKCKKCGHEQSGMFEYKIKFSWHEDTPRPKVIIGDSHLKTELW